MALACVQKKSGRNSARQTKIAQQTRED